MRRTRQNAQPTPVKCSECYGRGYDEHPGYYYGRAECSFCLGMGIINSNGKPLTEDEVEALSGAREQEQQ